MKVFLEKPGLQTTIQSRPRTGLRHLGVPASGPADPLSMALANRLVGNSSLTPALETTLTGATLRFDGDSFAAVTGALAECSLNGEPIGQHTTFAVQSGDVLSVGAAQTGVRSYIAIAGGLRGEEVLGSESTYLTAAFGGHEGRALANGDELSTRKDSAEIPLLQTPVEFRLSMVESWSVRTGVSCETSCLDDAGSLFEKKFRIGTRSDRMGIKLEGASFTTTSSSGQMPSVPVFPGTIQCPQDGGLYVMSVDAGTTGGYPRVGKITRMDLHILGQLRPGNSLTFIARSDEDAACELSEKHAYWRDWLPDISEVI